MNDIIIDGVGILQYEDDHWECWAVPTPIGPVDLQIDSKSIDQSLISEKIRTAINEIERIDNKARKYLCDNVPEDELIVFGELTEPSLLFSNEDNEWKLTIFYSCSNNDGIDCGVEFKDFEPFDLTISD